MVRKPDFFIVGAPKCGTTAMYYYLKQHPEIFMPEKKESHFFGSDLVSAGYIRTELEYLALFRNAGSAKRIGEASVWYLYSKRAAEEIKAFNPSADIIIMLRNPVDMMYSLHSQQLFNGTENIVNFEEALNAEEDRKRGKRMPNPKGKGLLEGCFYKEVAKYYEQVKRYLDTFGKDKVFIIIYDDLKNDTLAVYRRVLKFLGVQDYFIPSFNVVNPNKVVKNRFLQNFLQDPPYIIKKIIQFAIPRPLRERIRGAINAWNTKYVPRQPMSPELRRRLLNDFKEEIERLSVLIGRDLSFWLET